MKINKIKHTYPHLPFHPNSCAPTMPPTRKSTVDWCEPNYEWTPYIAESANAISSLCISFSSALTMYQTKTKTTSLKVRLAQVIGIAIGIGSAWFHGTLTYNGQLADELSMTYLMMVSVPTVLNLSTLRTIVLYAILLLHSVMTITLDTMPKYQYLIFQTVFMIQVALLAKVLYEKRSLTTRCNVTIVSFGVAGVCWLCDFYLCETIGHRYLHAMWHVVVSYTLYNYLHILVTLSGDSSVRVKKTI